MALLIARLLLAAVFVVAGLAKLADLAGSRQALRDFGVPAVLATPLGILLPLGELAVALALLPLTTTWWGALGALVLLLLFVVGIGYNLTRGRTPDCHCFGQIHSAPAGWLTLIRNLVLTAVAGLVVGFGRANAGVSAIGWLGALPMTQRIDLVVGSLLVALLGAVGWVLLQVLRQQGRLLVRIEALEAQLAAKGMAPAADAHTGGLPIGAAAPAFALASLHGERLTLDSLRAAGKSIVLVFSDPGCGPCTALLPEVGRWQSEYGSKLTLALVSRGTPETNSSKASEHALTRVLLQQDREVATAYQAYGTPSAVLVRPDGTIGSSLAQGADAIRALVAGAVGLPVLRTLPMATPPNGNGHVMAALSQQSARPKAGEPAPEFTLPDLTGKPVKLGDFRGSKTLLLFWNPGCGFRQRMVEDMKAWEAKPHRGAPKVLIVSTGTVEANEALSLKSIVVLDEGFTVAPRFGATGTPMAVLVDAEGNIASDLAAGAPAVLALAASGTDSTKSATR